MSKAYLRFLGTACGRLTPFRNHSSIALSVDERLYVLDCGEGAASSLLKAGHDLASLEAAFITHGHDDHMIGLPSLCTQSRSYGRSKHLPVYVPSTLVEPFGPVLEFFEVVLAPGRAGADLRPIRPGPVYQDDKISLSAHVNAHHAESYSFLIEIGDRRVLYSSDLRAPDEIRDLCEGVDLLITELAHYPVDAVVRALAGCSFGRLVITHLRWAHHGVSSEREIARDLTEGIGVPAQVATDGTVVLV